MVAITLQRLTKNFGAAAAVREVDLAVKPGELFFLLGPSGCGKTTLMRMIAGLVEPTSGTVRFGDRDVTRLPTAQRNTALVFQGYALWPHMTVAQNVAFGLDVRKIPADEKARRTAEALRIVRMSQYVDRRPTQLSGGQQQRVALARALVVNPDVLLLDEPLSNLDARLRLEMRGEVRRICTETRVTAIYVTHDQEEAMSIADRVAVMREGRVVQVGAPLEVYARPRSRFVAEFLGKTNFISATVQNGGGGPATLQTADGPLRSSSVPADFKVNSPATCMIRPECLRFVGDTATENSLAVRHVASSYLGPMAEHTVVTGSGLELAIQEFKPRPRNWAEAPLRVGFDAADLVVLAED
jgi:iron(III) transport system ATP-binding protein